MRFIGGQHPSPPGPPTFTLMPSAVTFRRWLTSDPSRSSRYPDRSAGISGLPLTSLRLACQTGQSRSSFGICNTIGCGRCPIRQGLEAGVPFPVGLSPASFTRHGPLQPSPASWRLASRLTGTFQGQLFHLRVHPLMLRPNGSSPACTGDGVFHPLHHCASWRTQIEEPIACGERASFHLHPTLPGMVGASLGWHQVGVYTTFVQKLARTYYRGPTIIGTETNGNP
jgi:hypothetical protein